MRIKQFLRALVVPCQLFLLRVKTVGEFRKQDYDSQANGLMGFWGPNKGIPSLLLICWSQAQLQRTPFSAGDSQQCLRSFYFPVKQLASSVQLDPFLLLLKELLFLLFSVYILHDAQGSQNFTVGLLRAYVVQSSVGSQDGHRSGQDPVETGTEGHFFLGQADSSQAPEEAGGC